MESCIWDTSAFMQRIWASRGRWGPLVAVRSWANSLIFYFLWDWVTYQKRMWNFFFSCRCWSIAFFLSFGGSQGMWKFPSQGSNLCQSSDPSRYSDSTGSSTCYTTSELDLIKSYKVVCYFVELHLLSTVLPLNIRGAPPLMKTYKSRQEWYGKKRRHYRSKWNLESTKYPSSL